MSIRKIFNCFSSKNKLKEYLKSREDNSSKEFLSLMQEKDRRVIFDLICDVFDIDDSVASKLLLTDRVIDLYKISSYKWYDDCELERLHMALIEKGIPLKDDELTVLNIGEIISRARTIKKS